MKKLYTTITGLILMLCAATPAMAANETYYDITNNIPQIADPNWQKVLDVAQYGGADWSNVIGMVNHVTVEEAKNIAMKDPNITYFFHMKGYRMTLVNGDTVRVFHAGDAVFFKGEPWWGSAEGYADGYVKTQH